MPEDSRDTDSLMMEENPAAGADALETHIIGGKCQASCFFAWLADYTGRLRIIAFHVGKIKGTTKCRSHLTSDQM